MKISKILAYLAIAAVGIVVVAELLVRLVLSQPLEPKRRFILENDIAGLEKRVEFEFDANFIRGFDSTKPKPDGALRILCVGGSSDGTMLQPESSTWWGQLGKLLEDSLGKKVQIGQLVAIDVARSIPAAQWADRVLDEVGGVDLVVGIFGHADLLQPRADFSFDPDSIEKIPPTRNGSLGYRLAKVSHLVRLARNIHVKSQRNDQQSQLGKTNYVRDRLANRAQFYRAVAATSAAPPRASDPIEAYLHGIGLLSEVAKAHGAKLMIVGEPTIFSIAPSAEVAEVLHTIVHTGPGENDFARPLPDWVDGELRRYYQAADSMMTKTGGSFVNLQGEILGTRGIFYAEASLTDAGSKEMAKLVQPVATAALK